MTTLLLVVVVMMRDVCIRRTRHEQSGVER
jgi:hypothetical protein